MHSAFNLLVFPYSMFTPLLLLFFVVVERAMCSPEKLHLKITIIIIIIIKLPDFTKQHNKILGQRVYVLLFKLHYSISKCNSR